MRVAFRSATPALGVGLAADARSALVAHARVPISAVQKLVAVAIVPMVASLLAIVLASDHLARPAASAVYGAYLVAACMCNRPVLVGRTAGEPVRPAADRLRRVRVADPLAGLE